MVKIGGHTQLLGVLGCPIEHSLSPALHNAALAFRSAELGAAELDYVYLPIRVESEDLKTVLRGMAAMGWRGFNVTIPHKQTVIQYLQQVSPVAQAVGAVNTVWRQDDAWFGTNTDIEGFLAPLLSQQIDWSRTEVCLLGSGGAARAVIAACAQLHCRKIHIVGRNTAKLIQLEQDFLKSGLELPLQLHPWEALNKLLPTIGLLVNTTPVGMYPQVEESPLTQEAIVRLPTDAIVYDLIYIPRPTRLLTLAQHHGCYVLDGLEMLIHQGAAAFKIWVGEAPSLPVMREALHRSLSSRA